MSLTYHDKIFLAPLAGGPKSRRNPRKPDTPFVEDPPGIGRSPRFAPGWWLAGTALFYFAIALLCIFAL